MLSGCVDEETAAALLAGKLSAEEAQGIEAHADACSSCREFISALAAAAASASPADSSAPPPASSVSPLAPTSIDAPRAPSVPLFTRGDKLGRYVVLERLGVGGMGVVYAAYDPELDRRVAIKLLRGLRASQDVARARLLREAQSLARLNDPHVVAVHDIGTFQDQVFLSMEFVDGGTISQWNKLGPRPWREVLTLFLAAGRGLAAAHRAGLVHRDFKPDNVMVGKDGRVRVTDFGLARDLGRTESDERGPSPPPKSPVLTQTGAVVGTPAYMAPEQQDGRSADARSDQFSFCVSLYEALYGVRPGPDPPEPPSTRGVPARLRRILVRGLSRDAAARYPTMDELLAELAFDPAARWRRIALAATAVLLIAAGVAAPLLLSRRQSRLCSGGAARFARVWSDARQSEVRAAILGTQVSWADSAAREVAAAIDAYGHAWVNMYTDACEATRVRGEQTENALELRMSCLDGRLDDVDALAGALAHTDGKRINRVIQAAHNLTPVRECADLAALSAPVRPPSDPAVRKQVDDARKRLATIKALYDTGDFAETRRRADALMNDLRPLGYAPLTAEALMLVAQVEQRQSDFDLSQKHYVEAALAAESANADDVAAVGWTRLVSVQTDAGQLKDAHRSVSFADAAVRRLRGRRGDIEGRLYRYSSELWRVEGKYPEAIADGLHALERTEAALGPAHLETAYALANLGAVYGSAEQHDKALSYQERAGKLVFAIYPPGHPQRDSYYTNLAADLFNLGRVKEAQEILETLVATVTARPGKPTLDVAWAIGDLGESYERTGQYDKGLALVRRALAIREQLVGPDHVDNALEYMRMAMIELDQKRPGEALTHATRAIAIIDAQKETTLFLEQALTVAGDARYALHQPELARPLYERAIKLSTDDKQGLSKRVMAVFGLARVIWDAGDPARGRDLARQARASIDGDPGNSDNLARLDAWLATHH